MVPFFATPGIGPRLQFRLVTGLIFQLSAWIFSLVYICNHLRSSISLSNCCINNILLIDWQVFRSLSSYQGIGNTHPSMDSLTARIWQLLLSMSGASPSLISDWLYSSNGSLFHLAMIPKQPRNTQVGCSAIGFDLMIVRPSIGII